VPQSVINEEFICKNTFIDLFMIVSRCLAELCPIILFSSLTCDRGFNWNEMLCRI